MVIRGQTIAIRQSKKTRNKWTNTRIHAQVGVRTLAIDLYLWRLYFCSSRCQTRVPRMADHSDGYIVHLFIGIKFLYKLMYNCICTSLSYIERFHIHGCIFLSFSYIDVLYTSSLDQGFFWTPFFTKVSSFVLLPPHLPLISTFSSLPTMQSNLTLFFS